MAAPSEHFLFTSLNYFTIFLMDNWQTVLFVLFGTFFVCLLLLWSARITARAVQRRLAERFDGLARQIEGLGDRLDDLETDLQKIRLRLNERQAPFPKSSPPIRVRDEEEMNPSFGMPTGRSRPRL